MFALVATACLIGAHLVAKGVLKETVDEDLGRMSIIAASMIDPARHSLLKDPAQQNLPDYTAITGPLLHLLSSSPNLKFIYTVRESPEGPRFVVDVAVPVVGDGDGAIDVAGLNELYEDPAEALLIALRTAEPGVSGEPYTDQWGTFISAYAPVKRADGSLECIVGVDITAEKYLARVAAMNRAIAFGGGLAVLSGAGLGLFILVIQKKRSAAVASLEESELLFRHFSKAAPVMLWMLDSEHRPTFFSECWLEFTGRSLEAEVADWSQAVHPDDRERALRMCAEAFGGRLPLEVEFRLRRHNGEYRWVLDRGTPRVGSDGRFLGYVGGAIDVTERHEAEQRQSMALRLATQLASASTISEAARLVTDALNDSAGIGRSAVLLFGDDGVCRFVWWRGISEAYRAAVEGHCPWAHHAADADPIVIDDTAEDESLANHRELLGRERIGSLAFIPVMTEQGVAGKLMLYSREARGIDASQLATANTLAAYLGMAVARLAAQERLATSERRIRTIIDTALDALVSMDGEGRITDWNAQAESTFGWTKAEAIGQSLGELIVPPELRATHAEGLRRYRATGESRVLGQRVEVPALRRDGATITVELAITPVKVAGGVHFSVFLRDITEKKLAHEELLRAKEAAEGSNQSKSEFLANMSHEIRTPMTAILGFADLLEEDGDYTRAPERRKEAISTIKRHGHGLLTIINDILDLSKIEAGKMTVECIECSVESVLEEVRSLMGVRAADKKLTLELVHETPIPERIKSDPTRLKQILINLVGNALKFTEVGGVTITAGCDRAALGGPVMRFEVSDTGIGLTEEQRSRLFRAFEQADTSTTRKYGGTGLGLRISERLVGLLGGTIDVKSEPGRGSTFGVTVAVGSLEGVAMLDPSEIMARIAEEEATKATASAAGAADPAMLAGRRLLLVEDGIDNQRLIAHHLRKAGAEVSLAENGRVALDMLTSPPVAGSDRRELIRPCPYDLVLMDMQMPVMDGYSAARRLRGLGFETPIIALTAHAMSGDRDKCLAAGCDEYATKPIDKVALVRTCRAMLDRKPGRSKAA